jgi:hypothetical protein
VTIREKAYGMKCHSSRAECNNFVTGVQQKYGS